MSKEKQPTPDNDIFDHDKEYFHESAGIDLRSRIAERIKDLNDNLQDKEISSKSQLAEAVMGAFTHKELACMWTVEVSSSLDSDPLSDVLEAIVRSGSAPKA